MKNNKKKIVAKKIAISFFFAAIFILLVYLFLYNKIMYYAALINTTAINIKKDNEDKAYYDIETKRLVKYPSYGSLYARLKISAIDLDLPVYHGDTLSILKNGVGHYAGSYFPGEGGSVIFAAHNNVGYFNRLIELKNNDKITVDSDYGTFIYEVYDYKVVDESNLNAFPIQNDEEILIMYTCYPMNAIGKVKTRYVVYSKKVGEIFE